MIEKLEHYANIHGTAELGYISSYASLSQVGLSQFKAMAIRNGNGHVLRQWQYAIATDTF